MEIAPIPRRPPLTGRGRLVVVLALFLPVTLFALVPTMLGMQRYVITSDSMAGSIDRGSLAFAHVVPVSDLRVGDVITFHPPGSTDGRLVTHRIVAIEGGRMRTQGDARAAPDRWVLAPDSPTQARVSYVVPYLGYPFLAPVGRTVFLALAVVPALLALALALVDGVRRRRRHAALVGAGPR